MPLQFLPQGFKNNQAFRSGLCILIAFAGGLIAAFLSVPLPYMLGGIAAPMIAAMVGAPIARPSKYIVTPMRITLGVLLGSAITPELFDRIPEVATTLAMLPAFIVVSAVLGTYYHERVAGYSREAAYFCSLPGGLHVMSLYAEERGIDIRIVSLAHALRITFVVILATLVTSLVWDLPEMRITNLADSIAEANLWDLIVLCISGLAGWAIGRRIGISGSEIVGPMICSALLHIAGITSAKPPVEMIIAAQVVLGAYIGSRFVGEKVGVLFSAIYFAFGHVCLMLCIAVCFAFLLNLMVAVPMITGMLAFAPGGMSEIGLITLALGLDVGFVTTIHLFRLTSINMLGPYFFVQIEGVLKRGGAS